MDIKYIYVAGALRGNSAIDYIQNLHRMIIYGEKLRKLGYFPYIPGLDFLVGIIDGNLQLPDYFNTSEAWLKRSDAVFVCPRSENSEGVKIELDTAHRLNIPIFYNIDELVQ